MDHFLLIFIVTIVFILLLFTLKYLGIGKKKSSRNCTNSCPDCEDVLNRIRRTQRDQFINLFTFRIFDARRYVCNNCGWGGLRWEERFRPGKD